MILLSGSFVVPVNISEREIKASVLNRGSELTNPRGWEAFLNSAESLQRRITDSGVVTVQGFQVAGGRYRVPVALTAAKAPEAGIPDPCHPWLEPIGSRRTRSIHHPGIRYEPSQNDKTNPISDSRAIDLSDCILNTCEELPMRF